MPCKKPAHKICGVYFCVWRLGMGTDFDGAFSYRQKSWYPYIPTVQGTRHTAVQGEGPRHGPVEHLFDMRQWGPYKKSSCFIRGATVLLRRARPNTESHYMVIQLRPTTNCERKGGKRWVTLHCIFLLYFTYWWCTYFLGIDKRRVHVSRSLFWEM